MREKPGQLIHLQWEGNPEAYYVKGHGDKGAAITEVENYHEALSMGKSPVVSYVWAKWCLATEDDGCPEGVEYVFRTRKTEHAGWFKVTEVKADPAKEG